MLFTKRAFFMAGAIVLSSTLRGDAPAKPATLEEARQIVARLEWTITSFQDLPAAVQVKLGGADKSKTPVMAGPGEDFNAGCVRVKELPDARMRYAACDKEYCLLAYEFGGFVLQRYVSLFHYTQSGARVIWRGVPHGEIADFPAFKAAMKDGRIEQDSFWDGRVDTNSATDKKAGK